MKIYHINGMISNNASSSDASTRNTQIQYVDSSIQMIKDLNYQQYCQSHSSIFAYLCEQNAHLLKKNAYLAKYNNKIKREKIKLLDENCQYKYKTQEYENELIHKTNMIKQLKKEQATLLKANYNYKSQITEYKHELIHQDNIIKHLNKTFTKYQNIDRYFAPHIQLVKKLDEFNKLYDDVQQTLQGKYSISTDKQQKLSEKFEECQALYIALPIQTLLDQQYNECEHLYQNIQSQTQSISISSQSNKKQHANIILKTTKKTTYNPITDNYLLEKQLTIPTLSKLRPKPNNKPNTHQRNTGPNSFTSAHDVSTPTNRYIKKR